MSEPISAPATARPGAPPAHDVTGGHNLIGNIGTGTATGACSGLANGAVTCEQAPIANKDQRGDSRNATTRGGYGSGAYDTGGAP